MKERIGGVMVCVSTAGRSIRSTLRVRVVTYSVQLHPGVVMLMVVINHMCLPHLLLYKSTDTTAHPLVGGCLLRMYTSQNGTDQHTEEEESITEHIPRGIKGHAG